jgi:TadE-like protein
MVESAIVIPLMTFMILGVLQLTMVQHARIMTEYAAFNAARAGIVWNADPWIMENAAIISLMPTSDRLIDDMTDPEKMVKKIVMRALMYQINRRLPEAVDLVNQGTDSLIAQLPSGLQGNASSMRDTIVTQAANWADAALQNAIKQALGGSDIRMVQVEILNPKMNDFDLLGGKFEIEFDDIKRGSSWRRQTQLTIQVRYLYMMKIPFANWIIHSAWRAHRAGIALYGAVYNPHTNDGDTSMFSKGGQRPDLQGSTNLDRVLARLASGDPGVYLVPLRAQYTMRMQSDPYRVSLMMNDAVDN